MNNKLVVGNLKMNMSFNDISVYLNEIKGRVNSKNVVICPTSIHIPYFVNLDFEVGVQDIFYENKGSYTSFLSPIQVKEIGVNYAIIGHSEKRKYDNEFESVINKKVISATNCGLNTILCIGETLEERSILKTDLVLRRQLFSALISVKRLDNLIIAYEPIWAIGTNKIPTLEDINSAVLYIKQIVKQYTGYNNIRVLYGGSVNSTNIKDINSIPSVDGVLIGGSSIDPLEFLKIKEVVLG